MQIIANIITTCDLGILSNRSSSKKQIDRNRDSSVPPRKKFNSRNGNSIHLRTLKGLLIWSSGQELIVDDHKELRLLKEPDRSPETIRTSFTK